MNKTLRRGLIRKRLILSHPWGPRKATLSIRAASALNTASVVLPLCILFTVPSGDSQPSATTPFHYRLTFSLVVAVAVVLFPPPLRPSVLRREAKLRSEATRRWLERPSGRMFGPFVSPSLKRLCRLNNGGSQKASAVTGITRYWQWKRCLNLPGRNFPGVFERCFSLFAWSNHIMSCQSFASVARHAEIDSLAALDKEGNSAIIQIDVPTSLPDCGEFGCFLRFCLPDLTLTALLGSRVTTALSS